MIFIILNLLNNFKNRDKFKSIEKAKNDDIINNIIQDKIIFKTHLNIFNGNFFIIDFNKIILFNYPLNNNCTENQFKFIIWHEKGHIKNKDNIYNNLKTFIIFNLENITLLYLFLYKNYFLILINLTLLLFLQKTTPKINFYEEINADLYAISNLNDNLKWEGILYLINNLYKKLNIVEWSYFIKNDIYKEEFLIALDYLKQLSYNNYTLSVLYKRIIYMINYNRIDLYE